MGDINIWFAIAMILFGFSGGVIVGVVVDRDKVVNQIFKKIRYKKGTGDIVIDVEAPEDQPKKRRRNR